MNKVFSHNYKEDPGNNKPPSEQDQEGINQNHHELNISDGSEFLDDGIRMTDQPFVGKETEEDNNTE
jgi:hypothetical protein